MTKKPASALLVLRAVSARPGNGVEVFASFLSSSALPRTGYIARVHDENDARGLHGFQHPQIRSYAKQRAAMQGDFAR